MTAPRFALLLGLVVFAGCATSDEPVDGAASGPALVDGKADYVAPASANSQAVLAYLSQPIGDDAVFAALKGDLTGDLDWWSRSYFAYRAGADEVRGTADDVTPASVAELAAATHMRRDNFWRLLNLAVERGFYTAPTPPTDVDVSDAIAHAPATWLAPTDLSVQPAFRRGFGLGDDVLRVKFQTDEEDDVVEGQIGSTTFNQAGASHMQPQDRVLVSWAHEKVAALTHRARRGSKNDTYEVSLLSDRTATNPADSWFTPGHFGIGTSPAGNLAFDADGNINFAFYERTSWPTRRTLGYVMCDPVCIEDIVALEYDHRVTAVAAVAGHGEERQMLVVRSRSVDSSVVDVFHRDVAGNWFKVQELDLASSFRAYGSPDGYYRATIEKIIVQQGYGRTVAVAMTDRGHVYVLEATPAGWEIRAEVTNTRPRNLGFGGQLFDARLTPMGLMFSTSGCTQYVEPSASKRTCSDGTWRVFREEDGFQTAEVHVSSDGNPFSTQTPWSPLLLDNGSAANQRRDAATAAFIDPIYEYDLQRGSGSEWSRIDVVGQAFYREVRAQCAVRGSNPGLMSVGCDVELYMPEREAPDATTRERRVWNYRFGYELDETMEFEHIGWRDGVMVRIAGRARAEGGKHFVDIEALEKEVPRHGYGDQWERRFENFEPFSIEL